MISLVTYKEGLKPVRQTKFSAAYDLHAAEAITLPAFKPRWVPTGVYWTVTPPDVGVHAVIYLRSKYWAEGLHCHSSPIDPDYEHEIKVGLRYLPVIEPQDDNDSYYIQEGERIAQLVIYRTMFIDEDVYVDETRNGGFGSTS